MEKKLENTIYVSEKIRHCTAAVYFAEDNFAPFFMLKKIGKLQCDSIVYTIASKLDILNCV